MHLERNLFSGHVVALHGSHVMIPAAAVNDLSDAALVHVIRGLAADYALVRDYDGGTELDGMTLDEAKRHIESRSPAETREIADRRARMSRLPSTAPVSRVFRGRGEKQGRTSARKGSATRRPK